MARSDVDKYLNRREKGTQRDVITPEGVPLRMTVADAGDRAAGFAIDVCIMFGVIIALALIAGFAGLDLQASWATAFLLVVIFFLRQFYFAFFELRWQGTTPGKRSIGLRVIDRRGGPLGSDAVIVRNLMREVEVFVPAAVLLAPEQLWPNAPGWARVVAGLWAGVMALMPLFNKDRLRVGDIVAGTMVVVAPKTFLMTDIGGLQASQAKADLVFTPEQLGVYGIYELQVLENVLREDSASYEHQMALHSVADRIKGKISWDPAMWKVDPERFLRAFYTALRAHLEKDLLFGKRKEDKFQRRP